MDGSNKNTGGVFASLLNRRGHRTEASPIAQREPELPEGWPRKLPFRKRPKPYSRAIRWSPVPDRPVLALKPPVIDRSRPYELFVAQVVLREVRQHLITASTSEPFGFLLGQAVYCPWTETPYVLIDAVRRETQSLPASTEVDRFRHAWIAATRDARHRRAQLIGWYHRHGVLGLRMSEWDLKLQDEFFPDPWQCALIIAAAGGPIGGFIQRSHRARLFRKGLAPFHELVDLDAKPVNGLAASVVDWGNYEPSQDVHVIEARWPALDRHAKRWADSTHSTEGVVSLRGAKNPVDILEFRPALNVAMEAEPEEAQAVEAWVDAGTRFPAAAEIEQAAEAESAAEAEPTAEAESAAEVEPAAEAGSAAEAEPAAEAELAVGAGPEPEIEEAIESQAIATAEETAKLDDPTEIAPQTDPEADLAAEMKPPTEPAQAGVDEPVDVEPVVPEAVAEERVAEVESTDPRASEVVEPQTTEPIAGPELKAETAPADEVEMAARYEPAVSPTVPLSPELPTGAEPEPPSPRVGSGGPARPGHGREIPVILIPDEPWRPPRNLVRVAAGTLILLAAGLGVRALLVGGRTPEAPQRPRSSDASTVFQQPVEFTRLASEFRSSLQDYRARYVEFQQNRATCGALAADMFSVDTKHAALLGFSSSRPSTAAAFSTIDADYQGAVTSFAATSCESAQPLVDGEVADSPSASEDIGRLTNSAPPGVERLPPQ